jgi:hypothetical protein
VRNPVEIDRVLDCRKYIERPAITGQAAIQTSLSHGMMRAFGTRLPIRPELRLMTASKQNTVLIVDDDGDVRELLSEYLEGKVLGYIVRRTAKLHLMKSENSRSRRK